MRKITFAIFCLATVFPMERARSDLYPDPRGPIKSAYDFATRMAHPVRVTSHPQRTVVQGIDLGNSCYFVLVLDGTDRASPRSAVLFLSKGTFCVLHTVGFISHLLKQKAISTTNEQILDKIRKEGKLLNVYEYCVRSERGSAFVVEDTGSAIVRFEAEPVQRMPGIFRHTVECLDIDTWR